MSISTIRALAGLLVVYMASQCHADVKAAEAVASNMISIGQPMQSRDEGQRAEAEGVVTFVGRRKDELSLELTTEAGHMQVTVAGANGGLAGLLLGSRVRAKGVCLGLHSIDGQVVSSLSAASRKDITILQVPPETWRRSPLLTISELARTLPAISPGQIVHLRGNILGTEADGTVRLGDRTGELKLHSSRTLPMAVGTQIELLAEAERQGTNVIFLPEVFRTIGKNEKESSRLPMLTSTEQVRWLNPAEANRGYPVRLRAVVTFVLGPPNEAAGNLQDGTGGIYAWHLVSSGGVTVKPGDYCEIEGETSAGAFSPGIICRKVTVLGQGQFPEPARPSWDELANGSLDAQWVEVEGIVLSTYNEHLEIRTQGGRLSCFVPDGKHLERFLNAVVLVRGVVVADWDQARHVQGLHLNLPSQEFISLEIPPLADPFSLPTKPIKDLLFYNPGESAFHREKVTGQIIGARNGVYYLMNGTNGLRLLPEKHIKLAVGDTVEAVGFPEIDNSTAPPVLTLWEAEVRKTGRKPMPAAAKIAANNLINSGYDSTLVRVAARVVHLGVYGADQVMELQAGARTFFARLNTTNGRLPPLPANCQVELTGVYVFNNNRSNAQAHAGPFEVLLNSPAALQVLEWPSWWTSKHALMVVSGMAMVMLLGVIWIGLLRQQVERRTAQLRAANRSLEAEIGERKRAENELVRTRLEHLVEQERTRIARDIHDELGSSLSQIRLLSEMTLAPNAGSSETQSNAGKISAKALEATHILDEIVWAVDPQNDTLESLLNYLFSFASDYLSLAGVRFRIDAPTRPPHHVLTAPIRHQLYMAVKETLTNIVNHAQAKEVWMRLRLEHDGACFIIEDDGRGFDVSSGVGVFPGASGLDNMRKRFKEIGGDFTVESVPNRGTRVKFVLPLNEKDKI